MKTKLRRIMTLLQILTLLLGCACATADEFVFEDKFLPEGSEAVWGESSYQSPWVNIQLTTVYNTEYKADITVADVYVRSLECFRRVFGKDTFASRSFSIKHYATETGAPLAITGDSGAVFNSSLVVGNGYIWRNTVNTKRDVAVIWKDGRMECFTSQEMVDEGIYDRADEIWHTFVFGPRLLKRDGSAYTERSEFSYKDVASSNPRAVIGYYEPGHYCLVLVAGRKTKSVVEPKKKNYGADLVEMSQIMADLGCKAAYNLDGGQSAVMCFRQEVVTATVNGGRIVGDAIIVCDPPEVAEE